MIRSSLLVIRKKIHHVFERILTNLSVLNHQLLYDESRSNPTTTYRIGKSVSQICSHCGGYFLQGANFGEVELRKLSPLYFDVNGNTLSIYPQAHEAKDKILIRNSDKTFSCPYCQKNHTTAISLKTLDIVVIIFY